MRFQDRTDAGRQLAERLSHLAGRADLLVLGLPRGGLPVAAEVARALAAPLDVWCVRKLGVPGHEELAMGAIAEGGGRALEETTRDAFGVSAGVLAQVTEDEAYELARRVRHYRGARAAPEVRGRTVVLVDDGLATGATMRAAVRAVRQGGAARVIVAVPVAPPDTAAQLAREADECICLAEPTPFFAVGLWYADFPQLTDAEVLAVLADARPVAAGAGADAAGAGAQPASGAA